MGTLAIAGSGLLAAALLVMPKQPADTSTQELCQQQVQAQSVLSREQLSQLLAIPERSTKTAVRQVIAEPFCLLPATSLRAGIPAEREAYPLAFDPSTWLVVLYEGDEYAGYDFSFRR